jgi:cytoskeleton protein RodZ
LSLQKAADEMHLDAWVVEALEADKYDRIGPAVYAKGHLRKYAAMLAIPGEEIVAAYDALHASAANPPPPSPAVRVHQAPPLVGNLPKGQIAAGIAFLFIVAGVLLWKPWQQRATPAAPGNQTPVQMPRGDASVPGAAGGSGERTRVAEPLEGEAKGREPATAGYTGGESPATAARATVQPAASSATGAAPIAVIGAGHARLRMSFSTDSWVEVRDSAGRSLFSGYGRANSVKVLAGDAPLRVYLGYASGVQLEINDHAVAIGRSLVHGDVARFQAGADGVLRSYSGGAQAGGAPASGAQPRG